MSKKFGNDKASKSEGAGPDPSSTAGREEWSFYTPNAGRPVMADASAGSSGQDFLTKKEAETLEEERDAATSMQRALRDNDLAKARLLLTEGFDVNNRDDEDNTALHDVAFEGREGLIQLLLDFGADIDAQNLGGFTPLMYAAERGHLGAVKILLARGANVNIIAPLHTKEGPRPGFSALSLAVQNGYAEVAKLLKDAGAKL